MTQHEYDVVTQYRNLGGNLKFLSANNFFRKITLHGDVMTRVAQWRDLGRPEAALIGVQYRANDRGQPRRMDRHRARRERPLRRRSGGGVRIRRIELDATAPSSPTGVRILAQIPNLYGPGFTGRMTYYDTPAGAKVFAAGAFTLAGSVWEADVEPVVERLWTEMSTG